MEGPWLMGSPPAPSATPACGAEPPQRVSAFRCCPEPEVASTPPTAGPNKPACRRAQNTSNSSSAASKTAFLRCGGQSQAFSHPAVPSVLRC